MNSILAMNSFTISIWSNPNRNIKPSKSLKFIQIS